MTLSRGMFISAGLAMATVILALAAAGCGGASKATKQASLSGVASQSASIAPAAVKLVIKSDEEHGKKGPEGKWHDAYLPSGFSVKPSQHVTVTIYNYDGGIHSFTAPGLNVNVMVPGGTATSPHTATFSFTAPAKAGSYEWFCDQPCDPWAMAQAGYMRGAITVA